MAQGTQHGDSRNDAEPAGFFKSSTQMVVVVTTLLVVPVAVISFMIGSDHGARDVDQMLPELVDARIRPVAGFELVEAKKGGPARTGDVVYKEVCAACHATGVSGSPKFGDKAAWEARIAQGLDVLLKSSAEGKGAMPAQVNSSNTAQEVANAVVYMANEAGASFEVPKLEEEKTE